MTPTISIIVPTLGHCVRILGFPSCVFSHFLSVLCMFMFSFSFLVGSLLVLFNFTLFCTKSRYHFELLFNLSNVSICSYFIFITFPLLHTLLSLSSNCLITAPIVCVNVNCFLLATVQLSITLPRVFLTI